MAARSKVVSAQRPLKRLLQDRSGRACRHTQYRSGGFLCQELFSGGNGARCFAPIAPGAINAFHNARHRFTMRDVSRCETRVSSTIQACMMQHCTIERCMCPIFGHCYHSTHRPPLLPSSRLVRSVVGAPPSEGPVRARSVRRSHVPIFQFFFLFPQAGLSRKCSSSF